MPEQTKLNGRCMCGAVTVTATATNPVLRACHCEMCRQHNSFAFMNIQTDTDSIEMNGPVKVYKSSDWAQRAFCETCGSTLWYGMQHDGSRNLAAGLFPDLGGAEMVQEYFADECLYGTGFSGDHQKLTRQETFALFAPSTGESQ
jgi:hypothetical protein